MTRTIKTLALAGASLFILGTSQAHANLDLNLGGYYAAYGVFADQDEAVGGAARNTHNFEMMNEAEIHLTGEKTFENGLTVGAVIELEAQTNGDQIDESYLYFSGDWGRVNVGSENGAAFLMQVAAPAVDSKFDGIDPSYVILNVGGNTAVSANSKRFNYSMGASGNAQRGDSDKFTYLSPVLNGFQIGASYTATGQEDGSVRDGMSSDKTSFDRRDEIQLAGTWSGSVEGFDVTAGMGYLTATKEAKIPNTDDREQWNVGLNVSYEGFTVGGNYFRDNNGFNSDDLVAAYALGASYKTGPYRLAVSYFNKRAEQLGGAEDKAERTLIGGTYYFAPGVKFNGAIHFYDLHDDQNLRSDENDATMITLGTIVDF